MLIRKSKMFALQNLEILQNHFAVNKICIAICELQNKNSSPGTKTPVIPHLLENKLITDFKLKAHLFTVIIF